MISQRKPLTLPRRLQGIRCAWWGVCLLCLAVLSCRSSSYRTALGDNTPVSARPDLAQLQCSTANFSLLQWQAEQAARGYALDYRSTWIAPVAGPEQAVALLVHGLNLRPDKMNPLARALSQQGIRVLRVTLHGHGCLNLHDFQQVDAEHWFYDILRAYCIAATYARQHALPLHYVGYSLGGSLVVEALHRQWAAALRLDAMVLLAPGIALRSRAAMLERFVPVLMRLPWIRRLTPRSRNLPDYTCHPGTPLQAYDARYQATQVLRRRGLRGLDHIPTMIFLDPDDELISWRDTQALLREADLRHWSLRPVRKSPGHLSTAPHHLLIDERVVGLEQWQTLSTQMLRHLLETPRAR